MPKHKVTQEEFDKMSDHLKGLHNYDDMTDEQKERFDKELHNSMEVVDAEDKKDNNDDDNNDHEPQEREREYEPHEKDDEDDLIL